MGTKNNSNLKMKIRTFYNSQSFEQIFFFGKQSFSQTLNVELAIRKAKSEHTYTGLRNGNSCGIKCLGRKLCGIDTLVYTLYENMKVNFFGTCPT